MVVDLAPEMLGMVGTHPHVTGGTLFFLAAILATDEIISNQIFESSVNCNVTSMNSCNSNSHVIYVLLLKIDAFVRMC